MKNLYKIWVTAAIMLIIASCNRETKKQVNLSKATILVSPAIKSPVKENAGKILIEEINQRTSLQLSISENWDNKTIIALALSGDKDLYGEALLLANGVRLTPTRYDKGFEQFKEFPLPNELIRDGKLKITFDKSDEEHLN
jgi:hypothetical protein